MKKPKSMRLVLLVVGLLLVLLGLRGVALTVAGKSVQAEVTAVNRAVGQQDDAMDHNYQISYRFSVGDKGYTGNLTRTRVYNAATLPSVGDKVTVRYVAAAPAINGGSDVKPLGTIVLGVIGIGVMFLAFKPPKSLVPRIDTASPNASAQDPPCENALEHQQA